MTALQCAYAIARNTERPLCGFTCQVMLEWSVSPDFNLEKANRAWFTLCRNHPALRARMTEDGVLSFAPESEISKIKIFPDSPELSESLVNMLNQRDQTLQNGAFFAAAEKQHQITKLFFCMDMLIADPFSFQIILAEFCQNYLGCPAYGTMEQKEAEYFSLVWKRDRQQKKTDKLYWQERIKDYAFLKFPVPEDRKFTGSYLHLTELLEIPVVEDTELILLSAFLLTMCQKLHQKKIVITYPQFGRMHGYENCVGDFSPNLFLGFCLDGIETFQELTEYVQHTVQEDRKHLCFDGTAVQNLYTRLHKEEVPEETLVFSPSLSRPLIPQEFESIGKLTEITSRTPMVSLDAQAYLHDGKILLEWVIPENWFRPEQIQDLFSSYCHHCRYFSILQHQKERIF